MHKFKIRHLPDVIFRFAPDGAQGGQGSDGDQQQGGNQNQASTQQSSAAQQSQGQSSGDNSDDNQGLARLLERYGNNALKVAETLMGDNFKLREKNRQLESQIEGAVILKGDDKTAWDKYKTLGTPSDVATKLRRGELDRIAARAGYHSDVFADLDRMAGGTLTYEIKPETVDGQSVERIYVKDSNDANATPKLLADFASEKWANYLPALQVQQGSNGTSARSNQQSNGGTPYPEQGTGGRGPQGGKDLTDSFLTEQNKKNEARRNPLLDKQ